MASSNDHHTDGLESIIKQHFLHLAQLLDKEHPIPLQSDGNTAILCPMPTGRGLQRDRDWIENFTRTFPQRMRTGRYGEWKDLRLISEDRKDFWLLIYRCEAFSSDEEATAQIMARKSQLPQIQYTAKELKNDK